MKYENMKEAVFLSRPNRFVAHVIMDGGKETVHVKNTGRCRELLVPGCTVFLEKSSNPKRKTGYDLVCVEKKRENKSPLLINMDSLVPNAVACEWLERCGMFSKNAVIKREVTYKNSRFDIFAHDGERRAFLEVKGVTLEKDGVAYFPDAPSLRAIKHLKELCEAIEEGYEAYLILIVQMKEIDYFTPNRETDPAFANELAEAVKSGVKVIALDCIVTPESVVADRKVKVVL